MKRLTSTLTVMMFLICGIAQANDKIGNGDIGSVGYDPILAQSKLSDVKIFQPMQMNTCDTPVVYQEVHYPGQGRYGTDLNVIEATCGHTTNHSYVILSSTDKLAPQFEQVDQQTLEVFEIAKSENGSTEVIRVKDTEVQKMTFQKLRKILFLD